MKPRQNFQQIVIEQLDIPAPKTQKNPTTSPPLKLIIDLNMKCKTIKLFGDDIEENLNDLGYGHDFLDTTPKT